MLLKAFSANFIQQKFKIQCVIFISRIIITNMIMTRPRTKITNPSHTKTVKSKESIFTSNVKNALAFFLNISMKEKVNIEKKITAAFFSFVFRYRFTSNRNLYIS